MVQSCPWVGRMRYGPGSHGCATTTEAVRRAIQHSQESLRVLAKRYGINPKTVAKWKGRGSVSDRPTGPKEAKSTVLSIEDEAIVVAFRRHTLLPLDDCLYALQADDPASDALVRCIAACSATASRGCPRSTATSRAGASSRPTRSATSTSTLPKCGRLKASCTSSWRSTGRRSSPSSSCTRRRPPASPATSFGR